MRVEMRKIKAKIKSAADDISKRPLTDLDHQKVNKIKKCYHDLRKLPHRYKNPMVISKISNFNLEKWLP